MNQNYLSILEESLVKKNKVLDKIKKICDEQHNLMSGEDIELESFDTFIDRKGELIGELEQLDEGFESLYEKVADELKENREQYSEQIRRMQGLISTITDKSNAIQVLEERNRTLISNYFGKRRNEVKEGRVNSRAALNYYKVQSSTSYVDAQFMDSKK